jgi:tRNA (guanine-N7-)-methyltransferase
LPAQSRAVSSNQCGLHPRLCTVVNRHLHSSYRRPAAPHSVSAYRLLLARLAQDPRPLVLDSFCGTGQSTAILAGRHPGHLVVGIDKSGHRLGRHVGAPADNYLLLQADCGDLWQLLLREGLTVDRHYLLYPNPWPKARHLQRRIHGHASFPWLLQLGGHIELRSNWQLYVEEFGVAMHLAGHPGVVARLPEAPAITLFEEKYRRSGHPLWCFRGRIQPGPAVT